MLCHHVDETISHSKIRLMKDIFIIVQAKVIAIIMIQLFEIIILLSYSDLTFIITVNTEAVNSLSDYSSILDLRRKLQ